MRKRALLPVAILLIGICLLTACDPKYPLGNIKVENVESISQGKTAKMKIVYPADSIFVSEWKDISVEIIEGEDIIEVSDEGSDFMITGLKPGTALIKVSATTVISEEAKEDGNEERVYSTEAEITVK